MTRQLDTSSTPSALDALTEDEKDLLASIPDEEQRMITFRDLLERHGLGDTVTFLNLAENALHYDVLRKRVFNKLPHPLPMARIRYASKADREAFIEKICPLLRGALGADVKPEHVSPTSGVSGALESISLALQSPDSVPTSAGPVPTQRGPVQVPKGSRVLIPAPCWQGFDWCFEEFPDLRCVWVPVFKGDRFELTVDDLEKAYKDCSPPPRMLVLTNPHNPLGVNYSPKLLESIYKWALGKKPTMHIISDEIYRHSQLTRCEGQFVSALKLIEGLDPEFGAPDRVHVVWGFSKDFGLSGFRMGLIISRAKYIHEFVTSSSEERRRLSWFSQFGSLKHLYLNPIVAQQGAESVWSTTMGKFPKKLTAAHDRIAGILDDYGIKYFRPSDGNSALFFWLDLREFLLERANIRPVSVLFSPDRLADPEKALGEEILKHAGVALLTGSEMHMEVQGFFRLCFTAYPVDRVATAVKKMCRYLKKGG
jgi:aspartate/methionine/tyrosine aminotransferase